MKSKTFGIDIGSVSMKAVWLEKENDTILLKAVSAIPTPAKGMLSESLLDQEEMAQALRHLNDEAKITTPYVNISLPESRVYTRVIEMPVLSDKELSSAIYWEAEQYIPVSLETLVLDYKVLSRPATIQEGTHMQVLLVGAPKTLIEKYQKIFSFAGLVISAIETEVLSLVRVLIATPQTATDKGGIFYNTMIVHIGATNTTITIVRNNIIVFVYSVPIGGAALTRAVAADTGVPLPQAEEYKRTYGMGADQTNKVGQSLSLILMSIVSEMKKAIAYYAEKYKDTPLQQILISGGSAKLQGITTFLQNACSLPVVVANPWQILGAARLPEETVIHADYTIAIGLGMRDL